MIKHIVLLKLSPSVTEAEVKAALGKLEKLRYSEIPQIQSITYGKNCNPDPLNMGFNYGFILEFLSLEDLKYYIDHPAHTKIAKEYIIPLTKGMDNPLIVLDYEF